MILAWLPALLTQTGTWVKKAAIMLSTNAHNSVAVVAVCQHLEGAMLGHDLHEASVFLDPVAPDLVVPPSGYWDRGVLVFPVPLRLEQENGRHRSTLLQLFSRGQPDFDVKVIFVRARLILNNQLARHATLRETKLPVALVDLPRVATRHPVPWLIAACQEIGIQQSAIRVAMADPEVVPVFQGMNDQRVILIA
jgi:hypothetical protein